MIAQGIMAGMSPEGKIMLTIPFLNRFLHWLVVGIGSTTLSLMMLSKGVPVQSIGLITGIYSAIVVLLEFPSGVLSDSIGRKTIYLVSLGLSMLGYSILFFADGFFPVLLGLCFYGAARAFSSGSIEALYIGDYIERNGKADLHRLISVMNAGETIGLTVGALLGGLIPMVWSRMAPSANRYNGNLLAQNIVLLILFVMTLVSSRGRDKQKKQSTGIIEHVGQSIKFVKGNRTVMILLAGVFVWGISFNAIEVYWQPQLRDIIGSDSQTWIFGIINSGYFLAALLGVVAVNFIYARRRNSYMRSLSVLRFVIGILIIVLSFQKTIGSFSAAYLTMFFFNGMANIPESTLFNLEFPEDKRSSLLSLSSLVMQLGGVFGSLVFSFLVGRTSISTVWVIAGTIFALSSLFYVSRRKAERVGEL